MIVSAECFATSSGRMLDRLMQIPDEIRKCVAFIAAMTSPGQMQLAGTAFFVVVPDELGKAFVYLVTAKHVLQDIKKHSIDNKAYIRVNQRERPSVFVETSLDGWDVHPTEPSVDCAVLPVSLDPLQFDYLCLPVNMAITQDAIASEQIGAGDEVFITGLFVNHFGNERNLPIIRTGNIALMPEEKIQTRRLGAIDAYLIEARSIGGLSGSPAFAYLGIARALKRPNKEGALESQYLTSKAPRHYWIGLVHGHFDAMMDQSDVADSDPFEREKVNMGIAIVIPVSKILEVINQDKLMKQREDLTRKRKELTGSDETARLKEI